MVVLIVDDSAAQRRIQQKALEAMGWSVHVASGGEDALAKLAALLHCDLMLTDWHMPGMDGLELVRAVRGSSRYGALPIVMVTSDGGLDSVDKALAAGVSDFIMKPFTAEALGERILEVMGG